MDPTPAGQPYTTADAIDLAAVRALLADAERVLEVGDATLRAADMFGERFTAPTDSVAEACEHLVQHAQREGDQELVYALAISGLAYASGWWGTPYWAETVNRQPATD